MASTTTGGEPIMDGSARVVLSGRITAYTAAPTWKSAIDTLDRNPSRPVVVDASRVEYADDVGIALLFDLAATRPSCRRESRDPRTRYRTSPPWSAASSLQGLRRVTARPTLAGHRRAHRPSDRATGRLSQDTRRLPRRVRERAGTGADAAWRCEVGVKCSTSRPRPARTPCRSSLLIGFLMGVIIAFEIGLVARKFGAVIFVVEWRRSRHAARARAL